MLNLESLLQRQDLSTHAGYLLFLFAHFTLHQGVAKGHAIDFLMLLFKSFDRPGDLIVNLLRLHRGLREVLRELASMPLYIFYPLLMKVLDPVADGYDSVHYIVVERLVLIGPDVSH